MSQVAAGSQKADPLRQQLDELDQLMARMLSLGVQPAPSEPPRESSGQPLANPASVEAPVEQTMEQVHELAPAVSSSILEAPVDAPYLPVFDFNGPAVKPAVTSHVQSSAAAELAPEPAIELAPSAPSFVSLEASAVVPAAPLFAEFQFAPPPSLPSLEPEPTPTIPRSILPPLAPTVIVAWWLQPLALVNYLYDGSTSWLGPIGRGLRSRPLRNLLGICGVACVLGALAWMLWEGTDWNS